MCLFSFTCRSSIRLWAHLTLSLIWPIRAGRCWSSVMRRLMCLWVCILVPHTPSLSEPARSKATDHPSSPSSQPRYHVRASPSPWQLSWLLICVHFSLLCRNKHKRTCSSVLTGIHESADHESVWCGSKNNVSLLTACLYDNIYFHTSNKWYFNKKHRKKEHKR